jgi:hypothetical protein
MLPSQIGEVILQRNLAKSRYSKSSKAFINGSFLLSWLISLFIIFGLSGCGSTDNTAAQGNTAPINSEKTVVYNFYDGNLDFLGIASSENVDLEAKAREYNVEKWYEANGAEPFNGVYEGNDEVVRLYAVKNVREIQTQEDLENINLDLSGNYILLNDITLEGEWTPIGSVENEPFSGILNSDTSDGERYAIKALKITLPNIPGISDIGAGLFEAIQDAIIKNIGVEIVNLIGDVNIGGIAGKAIFSNITNSYVVGNISGNGYIGGIVGRAERNSTISNSFANVSINAKQDVGGIVGYVNGSAIANSYATGSVSGSFNVGGIAGSITGGIIASAYSANDIKGDNDVGGITGSLFSSTLSANVVITPKDISDKLKKLIGDLTVVHVVDTNSKAFNSLTDTIKYILDSLRINGSINDKIEAYLDNIVSKINSFVVNTYNKLWDITINNTIVSWLDEQYVYEVKLGWNFGNDDANPWIIPAGGGAPILYWQVGE